ncbi:MAG: FecR domain-containing protein [Daejeonella sp.]|uniref:FecR family protein n=1 Tax=Daejeonella sp. TaxID=2805397 RepID=UPI0027327951|nr:FecR domain-containing protein [Daejeonella sp.]MDP3469375.1 FecR domain-containing protein [Daejeonella sp.]
MNNKYFSELLNKYLKHEASEEESELLIKHYNLFESEADIFDSLSQHRKADIRNEIENRIWDEILDDEILPKDVSSSNNGLWLKFLAVAAVLLIVFSAGLYFLKNEPVKQANVISRLTDIKENRLIQLPDGSTVILRPGAKLNYPSSFDGLAKREVYLDGQAYFDIKHNSSKQFIIHTGKLKTIVLGTAFEINAWSDDSSIRVTVSRGKVRVEDQSNRTLGVIMPNQQITYNKASKNIVQKVVNAPEYLEWKEQDLLLSDVTVAEATKLLESRYKVEIMISDDSISSKRFTTIVRKGETLDQILKSISEFNEAVFQYNADKTVITLGSK